MSDAIQPSLFDRIRHTPVRDVLRGRLSGRLDWRRRLAAAAIPENARLLIERVVRRTRLWRSEKAAVADELAAHFFDALRAGNAIEPALKTFGDEKRAARLIRRAKIRKRPWPWHAWHWAVRGIQLLVAIYLVLALMFFLPRPKVRVDYVAEVNRPILAVPPADRAWPIYRRVILGLATGQPPRRNGIELVMPSWIGKNVDGKHWPEAAAWLGSHQADVAALRNAAAMPSFGFVLGPGGSIDDDQLFPGFAGRQTGDSPTPPPLFTVFMPHLTYARVIASILAADAKLAQVKGGGARAQQDISAMMKLADQMRHDNQMLVAALTALSIDYDALAAANRGLQSDPQALGDQQWLGLAHEFSVPRTAADLFSVSAERDFFYDIAQRAYSDDGHGGGHLISSAMPYLELVDQAIPGADAGINSNTILAYALGPILMAGSASRRTALSTYDHLVDSDQANLHVPARDADWRAEDQFFAEYRISLNFQLKYALVGALTFAGQGLSRDAEKYLGQRDGITTAIALELYRRHAGAYPHKLDQLVPRFMPQVPADRITGEPIKYKLIDGKPLLYSVGADRIDDGGTPASISGSPDPTLAAQWWIQPNQAPRGDWILYPMPTKPDEAP